MSSISRRENDGAAGLACGDIFGLHGGQEPIAPRLVVEVHEHAGAEFPFRIRQQAKFQVREAANSFVNQLGVAAHGGDNPVQLAELREEHAAGEFAHAVVRAEVGLEARSKRIGSLVTTAPPSPAVMVLFSCRL